MDQSKALELIEPIASQLLDIQLLAYKEFDDCHPEPIRATVEGARPKWVHDRVCYHLDMAFGKAGPRRMKDHGGLKYLFVEGPDFNLGIRAKKLDADYRSYQHPSGQQDSLRQSGLFPDEVPTYHAILGYRDTGGLQPAISHVVLTWEKTADVEVIKVLWTASEGRLPVRPIQINLPEPPPPKMRRKKRADEGDKETGHA